MLQKITLFKIAFVFTLISFTFGLNAGVELQTQTTDRAEIKAFNEQALQTVLGRDLKLSERIGLRIVQRKIQKHLENFLTGDGDCARIVLKDGNIIEASSFEISSHNLSYIPCEDVEEKILTLSMSDVLSIIDDRGNMIYREGSSIMQDGPDNRRIHWTGIVSVVLGTIGLIAFSINPFGMIPYILSYHGIKLGLVGAILHKRNSAKYKENWIPWVGILLNSIPLLFQLFLMFFGFMILGF